ncbi:MAG: S8 family serine peptidase [Microgenomates group bacterium]|nr:S8 family serine peptidase [Microgenomates group bacterium]
MPILKSISKSTWLIFSFFFLIVVIAAGVHLDQKARILKNRAQEKVPPEFELKKPEYAKGEVIIKLKTGSLNLKSSGGQALSDKIPNPLNEIEETILPESLKSFKKKHPEAKIKKVFTNYTNPSDELKTFKQKFSEDLKTGKRKINEQGILKIDLGGIYLLSFDQNVPVESIILELINHPEVAYAEPNYIYTINAESNDPYYLDSYPDNIANRDPAWNPSYDYQWNLKKINVQQAWDIPLTHETIVAVIDTGVDYTHEEFGNCTLTMINNNQCQKITAGFNYIDLSDDPIDDHGHGTHVAGIIAAATNNNKGVASLDRNNNLRIMPIKSLAKDGAGYLDDVASSIVFASQNGAKVINMSLGSGPYEVEEETEREVIEFAFNFGVTIVASAGNKNIDVADGYWPANNQYVISVAATDQNDNKALYSNFGNIDVAAPGGEKPYNLLSLNAHDPANSSSFLNLGNLPVGNGYLRLAGTSMAAPHVAGLAGLILSKNPNLNPLEVRSIIELSADSMGDPGINSYFGWGRINAFKALSFNGSPPVAEIYSPTRNQIVHGVCEIIGTATAVNFSSFNLSVGLGAHPTQWSSLGITQTTNNSVENGLLGTIDVSYYKNQQFTIRLQTNTLTGQTKEAYVFVSNFIYSVPSLPSSPECPYPTRRFSIYYGYAYINNQLAPEGTKIWAVTPRGEIAGCQTVIENGMIQFMHVYGEDEPNMPGMRTNEPISIYVNDSYATTVPSTLFWQNDWNTHMIEVYAPAPGQQISLNTGWNWITQRTLIPDPAIAGALSSISGKYDQVLAENGIYSSWLPPVYNTLNNLSAGAMYMIHATDIAELKLYGEPIPVSQPISLHQGWNWIGYYGQSPMSITVALSSISGQYSSVLSEDEYYDPLNPDYSSLQTLIPNKGYLLKSKINQTLIYPSSTTQAANQATNSVLGVASTSLCKKTVTNIYTNVYAKIPKSVFNAKDDLTAKFITPSGVIAGCGTIQRNLLKITRLFGEESINGKIYPGFKKDDLVRVEIINNRTQKSIGTFATNFKFTPDDQAHFIEIVTSSQSPTPTPRRKK